MDNKKRLKRLRKRYKKLCKLNTVLEYNGNQVTVKTQRTLKKIKTFDFEEMKRKYIINPII